MTKRIQAKSKICRRLGVNLWGRPKNPIVKRDYPPGQHGAKRRKASDYSQQLAAKQKLRRYYGNITERQFRRVYQEASRRRGDTAENMIGLLEQRLDIVVYRLNFVPTVFAARQFVNHGHILVNDHRVDIPSYQCKPGDVIQVREANRSRQLAMRMLDMTQARPILDWLTMDRDKLVGSVSRVPEREEIDPMVNEQLVVELYSR